MTSQYDYENCFDLMESLKGSLGPQGRLQRASFGNCCSGKTLFPETTILLWVWTYRPHRPGGAQWGKKLVKSQVCVGALHPAPFSSLPMSVSCQTIV